jgi:hypothetical protein
LPIVATRRLQSFYYQRLLNNTLVSLAVVIGGGWTLYTFGIQRARESYIRLDLELMDSRSNGQHGNIIIRTKAVNVGRTGIGKKLAWMEVFPLACPAADVDAIQSPQLQRDAHGRRFVIFGRSSYLEPGEEFLDMLLLQIPSDISYIFVRLFFSGTKQGQTWHTQHVLYVGK